jgi:hypothetical protein
VSTHRQPGAIKVATSKRYALARLTAVVSVNATQQFGRFRGRSGHGADIENRLLMTHHDTSRTSITALQQDYSIASSGANGLQVSSAIS